MLNQTQIRILMNQAHNRVGEFQAFNDIFINGYKTALEDVLEYQRPKARPSQIQEVKND